LLGPNFLISDVIFKPVSYLLRDENNLYPSATVGITEHKLSILNIPGSELQDFTNSHPTSGHQLQDKSVSRVLRPEDDLIDKLLFQYLPGGGFTSLKSFLRIGVSHGFCKVGLTELLMKLKKEESREYRSLLVVCLTPWVDCVRNARISSAVMDSSSLSPN
jgi:hypothetical protein